MALTPAADDPKREEELKRRTREPETFGIGGGRSRAVAAKREDEEKAPPAPPAPPAPTSGKK